MLGAVGRAATRLSTMAATAGGAAIAWSRFAVDHDLDLGPSVDGERLDVDDGSGGSVAVYRSASGTGIPVLLVHSVNAAASAYEMKPLFDHFEPRRPVLALDLPGTGTPPAATAPTRLSSWPTPSRTCSRPSTGPPMSLPCLFRRSSLLERPSDTRNDSRA